ncbi:MAG TPA: hypothetical protein VFS39_00045 [Nitrospira sp.]|nr:hypothetical protein [Nitrospira sp.]
MPVMISPGAAADTCPGTIEQRFHCLATYRGIGAVLASLIGPGPTPESERVYQSHIYSDRLDIVAVDPDSGAHHVFSSPIPGENGAWALAWGPDGNLYIGTLPHAHLFQLNPRTETITDLGRPSDSEEYIWNLTVGADGKLYGGTYPSAKLIRFDPVSGRSEDLGRMDPVEQYANSVAASDDGFMYVGIGYGAAHLIAYEIASDRRRDIWPAQYQRPGNVIVRRHDDGHVYANMGEQYYRLQGWDLFPVVPAEVPSVPPGNRLKDGRVILEAVEGRLRVHDPATNVTTEHSIRYAGSDLGIFRLGLGPDGMLYGSGYMPAHFFRLQPAGGAVEELGTMGAGEVYSFLSQNRTVLAAAYVGLSPLMAYDPSKPFLPGPSAEGNPRLVKTPEPYLSWRPMAMITGPDGKVYLGAQAEYGTLGGPLVIWDTATDHVESYPHFVRDQSVISLTSAQGVIIGGTTTQGGGGSHPTQSHATLFVWDAAGRRTLFETPVAGSAITDLVATPEGLVYGFADETLFRFDLTSHRLTLTTASVRGLIYNSMMVAPGGSIWGLSGEGIFTIDPASQSVRLIAKAPEPVTAGFALQWPFLYYASGPRIYRYRLD